MAVPSMSGSLGTHVRTTDMQLLAACVKYCLAKAVLLAGNFGCGIRQIAAYPKAALTAAETAAATAAAAGGKLLKQHRPLNQHKRLQQHKLHTSSHAWFPAGSMVLFKPLSLPMYANPYYPLVACLDVRPAAQVADFVCEQARNMQRTYPFS